MVVPWFELETPMEISSISWQHSHEGDTTAWYADTEMYLGLCPDTVLSPFFDLNFIEGTKTQVLAADTMVLTTGYYEWVTFQLPQPFTVPEGANLLIEMSRNGGDGFFFTWRWYTRGMRTLSATDPGAVTGYLDDVSSMLMIEFEEETSEVTWGAMKAGIAD